MARILAVGIATIDIINEVENYPAEDSEVRALAQSVRRGGNATNTLVVLAGLGHDAEWAGVLVAEPGAERVLRDLAQAGVGSGYCHRMTKGRMPTSYITLSRLKGSRTIVHYRDLPEYPADTFTRIPLNRFDWVHFEGRNISETRVMMQYLREHAHTARVSLEVEKPRAGMESLYPFADLIVFSEAFAAAVERTPEQLLDEVRAANSTAMLICTRGARGAIGLDAAGRTAQSPAFPPARVVDTIGAGDTFNAAVIDALLRGQPLQQVLRFACRLAGAKCGQQGFNGVSKAIGQDI